MSAKSTVTHRPSSDPFKAHRLSTMDCTQSPPITTTPDDVFYVLKVVLTRLLASGSLPHVERTLGHLREIMERDFAGIIKRKMDDVYRGTGGSGDRPLRASDKAEHDSRTSFIVRPWPSRFVIAHTVQDPPQRLGRVVITPRASSH